MGIGLGSENAAGPATGMKLILDLGPGPYQAGAEAKAKPRRVVVPVLVPALVATLWCQHQPDSHSRLGSSQALVELVPAPVAVLVPVVSLK